MMMRKLGKISLAVLTLILLSLTVSVGFSYATVPEISALEKQVSVDDAGYSYVAHNRAHKSEIYRLDPQGRTVMFYSEPNGFGSVKSYITELEQHNGALYAVRQCIDERTNATVRQELLRLECESAWTRPHVLYTYQGMGIPPIISITAEDDTLYVCALKNGGAKAYVDAVSLREPCKIQESMAFSAQFNNGFYYGEYHNERLYAVSKSGEVLEYYGNSMRNLLADATLRYGRITKLSVTPGGVRFYDDLSGDAFLYSDAAELSRYPTAQEEKIFTWDESDGNTLRLSENNELKCTLELDHAQQHSTISQIRIPFPLHLLRALPLAALIFLAIAAIVLLVMASARLAGRQKRILAKFIIIIMPVVLFAFAGFGAVQYFSMQKTLTATRFTMAEELNTLTKKALDIQALAEIQNAQTYKTYGYRVLQNTLRTGNSDGMTKVDGLVIKNEAMVLKAEKLYTGVSPDQPCCYRVSSVYPPELVRLMQRGMAENVMITEKTSDRYGQWITAVSPVVDPGGGKVGLMMTRVSTADIGVYLQQYLKHYLLIMLLLTVIMLIPITVSFRSILRPLRLLENGMERVMNGEYDTTIDNGTRDEFLGITRGFNKMCTDLSRQIYQLNNISNSYYRFMPRSVFKLLDKQNILDVNEGDLRSLTCSLSVLSVHNLSKLRSLMSDMEFMSYIGRLTTYMNDTIEQCHGVLMSSDMDLSRLKVIFPTATADATAFALTVSEYLRSADMRIGEVVPEATVMLHYTDLLYGVTGKKDLIFPILMSSEADFVTQMVQRFGASGAKIVLTGAFADRADPKPPVRYIGYRMQTKEKRHELYQVLPTGAFDSQHSAQEKTFSNGLTLFYQGDFYNARNLFSMALKQMPESGIARWYVLAADKYYQYPDQYINYELFGTDTHWA